MSKELRCIHRHTIKEHPGCFARGLVKATTPVKTKVEKVPEQIVTEKLPWYRTSGTKIGFLDIESDGLKADFSTMLSWAIKELDGPVHTDVVNKKELFDGIYDRRIVGTCLECMSQFDIICTYFGTNFDLPYLRTKSLRHNLEFPGYGQLYHWDLFFLVKSKLNLSRKSLENVCDYLGIVGKTPIDKDVWRAAKYGDPASLQEVVSHNIGDVVILEELYKRINNFRKWTKLSV